MTDLPNRDHLATTNPVPNWNQHFAALGGLYDVVSEMMGTQAQQALTIAAGTITPSRGSIMVDTEAAAASDDLTTIAQTNLPDGRWLYLRSASGARTVVVKHGAGGAGQVLLANAADFSINATDKWLLLERYGTAWREVDRGYGADLAGLRAYLGDGNLLGAIGGLPLAGGSMNGALNMAKGANVASAATCDIWSPGDGNLIHVTGTTTITSLGAAPQAGAHRVVVFDGVLTLTNGANLIVPGAANYTTAAGDMAFVYAETTTQHRLRILKADGTAVVSAGGGGGSYEYVSTTTISSGASTAEITLPAGDYDFVVVVNGLRVGTGGAAIYVRWGTGAGPTWNTSTQYRYNVLKHATSTLSGADYTTLGNTVFNIAPSLYAGENWGGEFVVEAAGLSVYHPVSAHMSGYDNSDTWVSHRMLGTARESSPLTGLQFYPSSGTFSGGTLVLFKRKRSA